MSPLLEDELRAALAARAHDVSPELHLADAAVSRAERLRRAKRVQITAGAVVVAVAVAIVPVLSALGPSDQSAPTIQPVPSASAEPVPASVIAQAADTHALLGTATTIVDGSGAQVVTVPLALKDTVQGGVNQLRSIHRAAGGYVAFLAPNLPGDRDPADDDPVQVQFVRPDGNGVILGHPKSDSRVVVSPEGSLVAFEATSAPGKEHLLVVTDLNGRTLHQHNLSAAQQVLYLTSGGLWFACARLTCRDIEDNNPRYWDFATDEVTVPPLPAKALWAAQSGDQMLVGVPGPELELVAYDVSSPAAPRRLWSLPYIQWVAFDGSGTRLLASDASTEELVSVDPTTGQVLDRDDLGVFGGFPVWSTNQQWLVHSFSDDTSDEQVNVVTPAADGSLSSVLKSYPPYATLDYLPASTPLIGLELPPPSGHGG